MQTIIDAFKNSFPLTITVYLCLMVAVVGITTLLERFCVVLKNKTNLSDGFVGGIVLGVITSLPELVTCIATIIITKKGDQGFGDILGSNIFDLFVMCLCLLFCVKRFVKKSVNKTNVRTLVFTTIGTLFVLLAVIAGNYWSDKFVWHGFNLFSVFIFLSYVVAVVFMFKTAKSSTKKTKAELKEESKIKKSKLFKLHTPTVVICIIVLAIILITASVFLSYSADALINVHWQLNESFGAAILLGIVTSLPEIVACVNLCIHKEYNMVIDTMVGSTCFNLSILTIANIVLSCLPEFGTMFIMTNHNILQLAVCFFIMIVCLIYFGFNRPKAKERLSSKGSIKINSILLSIAIASYIAFLIIGFIWK